MQNSALNLMCGGWTGVNNWFPDCKSDTYWDIVMKLHTLTPHESRCTLLNLRSKGQGHGAWLFVNGFWTITESVINLWSWNFIHLLPMSQGCTVLILWSRSRSWRMVNCNWFLDYNWACNQPMIMKLHTVTPHESRCTLLKLRSKGQGHGAWLIVIGFRTITEPVINLWSWNFIPYKRKFSRESRVIWKRENMSPRKIVLEKKV